MEYAAWLDALVAKGKVTQELAAEVKRLFRLGEEMLPYRTEKRLTIKIKSRITIKKSTGPSSLNSTENSEGSAGLPKSAVGRTSYTSRSPRADKLTIRQQHRLC